MIKKIINYYLNFYIRVFSNKFFHSFHHFVIHSSQRAIGYKNFGNLELTGEKKLLKIISKHKIKLSIDIGANVGNFAKEILLTTNSFVVAIEPMNESYKKLKKLEFHFNKRIVCFNIALSDKAEKKKIYFQSPKSELASFNENIKNLNYINKKKIKYKIINSITLDNFIKKNKNLFKIGVDFIKIDTEGHDHKILQGAEKTIKLFKPKFIQFEMNWHYLFDGINIYYICSKFHEYNLFRVLPYESGLVKADFQHPNDNIFHLSNFVLVRKDIKV